MENMTIGLCFAGIVKVGGREFCLHEKRGARFIKSKKSALNAPLKKLMEIIQIQNLVNSQVIDFLFKISWTFLFNFICLKKAYGRRKLSFCVYLRF